MAQTKAQLLNPLNGNLNVVGIVTSGGFKVGTGISMIGEGVKATAFYGNATSATSATSSTTATTATTATNAQGLTGTPDIAVRNLTGVAATFTGVLTYEDVTNVDSIGVVTARAGIKFGLAGVGGTITADGHAEFVGVCTSSSFIKEGGTSSQFLKGDGSVDSTSYANTGKAIAMAIVFG